MNTTRFKKTTGCLLVCLLALIVSACSARTSRSYTFQVENGDAIKVELDTTDGLSLTQENGRFKVCDGDEDILDGIFILEDTYKEYLQVKEQPGVTVIEDKEKDGNSYFLYEVEGTAGIEDNHILFVKGSKTGVILGSLAGKEKAQEAFAKLTITLE